jgi:flagellar motor switch protein FliN/FliY
MDTKEAEPKPVTAPGPAESVSRIPHDSGRPSKDASVVAHVADFPELTSEGAGAAGLGSLSSLMDVTVTVTAELGRIKRSIGSILKLGVGSVVDLDRNMGEPVDLLVQGTLVARGEVVVVEDRFAIRIKEIVDPKFGSKK